MSKEGSSGGSVNQDTSGNQDASTGDPNAQVGEKKSHKKIIRLVTVMAYMVSVSSGAMALSGYYLFLWKPPNPRLMHLPQRFQGEPQVYMMNDGPNNISSSYINSRMIDIEEEPELTSNESMKIAISNLRNSLINGFRNQQSTVDSKVIPSEQTKVNNLRLKKDLRYKEELSLIGIINRRINETLKSKQNSIANNNISTNLSDKIEKEIQNYSKLGDKMKEETSFDIAERNSTKENLNLKFIDDGSNNYERPPSNRSNSTILDTQFEAMKMKTITSNVKSSEGTDKSSTTSHRNDYKFFPTSVTQKMPIIASTITPLENAFSINQSNITEDPNTYNKSRN